MRLRCTRCGIDSRAEVCRDCLDITSRELARATIEQRLANLLQQRDVLDGEIAQLMADLQPVTGKKRPRNVIPPCGTESAYQRHRARGEDRDDDCKKAHAAYERARRITRKAA